MLLEFSLFGAMTVAILIKWYTTMGLRDRRLKLAAAYDEQGQAKSRLKALATDAALAGRETDKLNRHIKATAHKIARLQQEYDALMKNAASRTEMDQEKLRLAQEAHRSR